MVNNKITQLIQYGITRGLIDVEDKYWALNGILSVLGLDSYEAPEDMHEFETPLQEILTELIDDAVSRGVVADDKTSRDIANSTLMAFLTPRPSQVIEKFWNQYSISPQMATEWFYDFSRYTNYIRSYEVIKDIKWVADTEYGGLDITINMSKPEKDPKAIAAAKLQQSHSYPKCQLCREAEGYCGRVDYPPRANHRVIPMKLNGENYFLQYSPYVYFNEHCIVINEKHVPAKMDKATFQHLLDFVRQFPHYFMGSNAELPIVGGSILSHDHYQGGRYSFAMERAEVESYVNFEGFADVEAGIVCWPMSVIRLRCKDSGRLAELADRILTAWRSYSDESVGIIASTDGEVHNTVTPIARRRGKDYEMDLVLRNNRCTEEYPLGIFHPHQELHHIKKENIGLIEVMGLAVLPSRLKAELDALEKALKNGEDLRSSELTAKHADWAEELKGRYDFSAVNVQQVLRQEVGQVFKQVLEQCGVFKRDKEGQEAFKRFLESVK
jgi:UDPglucose--hexose-1-phosphate uridylyltransferase